MENKKLKIFDKEFDVELISFKDDSTDGNPNVKVIFKTGGEIYHYSYGGGHTMALAYVVKENSETGKTEYVYSPWKYIPDGSYYEEIGRRLSIEKKQKHEI